MTDAVVVEVGGTSTNIAAIRSGRPSMSYVRVASHATALRSVDVRVVGVAGGSMLRARRGRVYGIGPRSAHIAGMGYASLMSAPDLEGATVEIGAPRPGDPADYVSLRTVSGERVAVTTTCAANLLGVPEPGDYCSGSREAAGVAFGLVAARLHSDASTIAEQMLTAASDAVCELALNVAGSAKLRSPSIVGVGGGAGGLARYVAKRLGWPLEIPPHAEIISSIGDALSLIRAERERTVDVADVATIEAMMADVEAEVVSAGASPASVEVRVEEVPERHTLRAIATGAVGLAAGAKPGRHECELPELQADAPRGATVTPAGRYWLVTHGDDLTVLDRYGDEMVALRGELTSAGALGATMERLTRFRGPITLRPTVWIVDDKRLLELAPTQAGTETYPDRPGVMYLVGRPR